MLSLLNQQSHIKELISSGQLSLRKNWFELFDVLENVDFPHLDLDFLRHYTCGAYQLKMSEPYAKAHLYENDKEFELQISPDYDQLILCRLHRYVMNLIIMMKINQSKTTSVSIKIGNERSGVALMWQQYCGTLAMLITLGGHLKPAPINEKKKFTAC